MGYKASPELQCVGKIPYLLRGNAEKVKRSMRGQGRGRIEEYRCPHCGWWHVGHRPPFKAHR